MEDGSFGSLMTDVLLFIGKNRKRFFRYRARFAAANGAVLAAAGTVA
jgi:hypothetical protein